MITVDNNVGDGNFFLLMLKLFFNFVFKVGW